ncbi:MAG TPA: Maf family protein [Solirubrobacteraceae bacterium]|jgi:septum formation protein|nr:Maf family protein [Solirubrobacteraceae bacterium]
MQAARQPPALVLASRSPQRRAILAQVGVDFEVVDVDVEELAHGPAADIARANALRKAQAGLAARPGATVLGVDTVVALAGEIFGKPASARDAETTLRRLSGRTHEVVSGLALLAPGNPQVVHEATTVRFRELPDEVVTRYVATGEWVGRAGGYAIQEQGAALVRAVCGDYLNVVGLPVGALLDLDSSLILRER